MVGVFRKREDVEEVFRENEIDVVGRTKDEIDVIVREKDKPKKKKLKAEKKESKVAKIAKSVVSGVVEGIKEATAEASATKPKVKKGAKTSEKKVRAKREKLKKAVEQDFTPKREFLTRSGLDRFAEDRTTTLSGNASPLFAGEVVRSDALKFFSSDDKPKGVTFEPKFSLLKK